MVYSWLMPMLGSMVFCAGATTLDLLTISLVSLAVDSGSGSACLSLLASLHRHSLVVLTDHKQRKAENVPVYKDTFKVWRQGT